MLQTVEAELDVNGNVRLLEPLPVNATSRVIVTLLETKPQAAPVKGTGAALLDLLNSPKFVNRKSYSAEEIEAQIEEYRNSWDDASPPKANAAAALKFLRENRLPDAARPSVEEIEAQIIELR